MKFTQAGALWLNSKKNDVKKTSLKEYQKLLGIICNKIGEYELGEIKPKMIQDYLDDLYVKKNLAKSTIKKYRLVISAVYSYVIGNEIEPNIYNPCQHTRTPKLATYKPRRALTDEEVKAVISNRHNGYMEFYAYMLLMTGLRRSELLALRWEDISWSQGQADIYKVVIFVSGMPQITYILKNGEPHRYAMLPSPLLEDLRIKANNQKGFIFAIDGELPTEGQFIARWKAYRIRIGEPEITQHMLRHTFCSMLYNAKIDVKSAQLLMGHKDIRTTLNIYTHIESEQVVKNTISQVNDWLAHLSL